MTGYSLLGSVAIWPPQSARSCCQPRRPFNQAAVQCTALKGGTSTVIRRVYAIDHNIHTITYVPYGSDNTRYGCILKIRKYLRISRRACFYGYGVYPTLPMPESVVREHKSVSVRSASAPNVSKIIVAMGFATVECKSACIPTTSIRATAESDQGNAVAAAIAQS
jgi:hypothetical protein